MKTFANTISFLFHPLLMATYGILIVLSASYLSLFPIKVKLIIAACTFVSTALVPAVFIFFLIRNGAATDIELSNRKERALPYLIIITSFIICIFYLQRMNMPFWIISVVSGATVALLIALCINFFWKISAHALGIGGLLGAVMGVSRIHLVNPWLAFIALFLVVGLVCTSRIYLNRHTPLQTYAGACLGYASTFSAALISYHYLFIL